MRRAVWLAAMAALGVAGAAHSQVTAKPLAIVAAENLYGGMAQEIAGPGIAVTSVLNNPDQDPHLFEASPSTARALAEAAIVLCNGADYDPWIEVLLRANRAPGRQVVVAATLSQTPPGANPHLWYDPAVMPRMAHALADALATRDPANAAAYRQRLAAFEASLRPLTDKVAALRARFAGQPVTATEPVFGYMAAAIGLVMRNERFQRAIMNGTEPRPSDVAAFQADLRGHAVRAMLYNSQATGPAARRLLQIAQDSGIPVVGVTETEPAGLTYAAWMLGQLDALEAALGGAP